MRLWMVAWAATPGALLPLYCLDFETLHASVLFLLLKLMHIAGDGVVEAIAC